MFVVIPVNPALMTVGLNSSSNDPICFISYCLMLFMFMFFICSFMKK